MASDEKIKRSKPDDVEHLPGKMICYDCDAIVDINDINWMDTNFERDERPFCRSCAYGCDGCQH